MPRHRPLLTERQGPVHTEKLLDLAPLAPLFSSLPLAGKAEWPFSLAALGSCGCLPLSPQGSLSQYFPGQRHFLP